MVMKFLYVEEVHCILVFLFCLLKPPLVEFCLRFTHKYSILRREVSHVQLGRLALLFSLSGVSFGHANIMQPEA